MSVRQRIALAMTAAVLVNVVAGLASWRLNDRADANELEARHATTRAEWVSELSGAATAFMSEAADLALGLRSGASEEVSAEHGDPVGADAAVSRLIDRMPDGLEGDLADRILGEWDAVRPGVLTWVNLGAEEAGMPLRLSLTEAGQLRSSVSTNIDTDASAARTAAVEARHTARTVTLAAIALSVFVALAAAV